LTGKALVLFDSHLARETAERQILDLLLLAPAKEKKVSLQKKRRGSEPTG